MSLFRHLPQNTHRKCYQTNSPFGCNIYFDSSHPNLKSESDQAESHNASSHQAKRRDFYEAQTIVNNLERTQNFQEIND